MASGDLDAVTGFVEEDEQYRVEHGHLDTQLNQGCKAVDGLSKVRGLGVEIDFFDFAVGAHHGWQPPERNRERSIGLQLVAWNVGFVERIQSMKAPNPSINPRNRRGWRIVDSKQTKTCTCKVATNA